MLRPNTMNVGSCEQKNHLLAIEDNRKTMSLKRILLLLMIWTGGIAATLQLSRLPGDWGHVCGPWGCGPSVKALLVWHLFWLVFLSLPAFLAMPSLSSVWLHRLGFVSVSVGLLGIAAVLATEVFAGNRDSFDAGVPFVLSRALFRIATLVDVPLLQLILWGALCWGVAARPWPRVPRVWQTKASRPRSRQEESAGEHQVTGSS